MKFSKTLAESGVAEWIGAGKYLDYRHCKKILKQLEKAVRSAERRSLQNDASQYGLLESSTPAQWLNQHRRNSTQQRPILRKSGKSRSDSGKRSTNRKGGDAEARSNTTTALLNPRSQVTRYGSIIATPPDHEDSFTKRLSREDTRQATSVDDQRDPDDNPEGSQTAGSSPEIPSREPELSATQHESDDQAYNEDASTGPSREEKRSNALPQLQLSRPHRPSFLGRVLSAPRSKKAANAANTEEIALGAYREADSRQAEFFEFLDKELRKIEEFYEQQESQSTERLKVLREQLHELRDRRVKEMENSEQKERQQQQNGDEGMVNGTAKARKSSHQQIAASVASAVETAVQKARHPHTSVRETSKFLRAMQSTSDIPAVGSQRDFHPTFSDNDVSYRSAKQKLKSALIEYYRGLELLKNYAFLNRLAFRKITKKCDKMVPATAHDATPGREFLAAHVNSTKFVTSETVDTLMQSTEDYYARYFERGNRKMAISKLRSRGFRSVDYSAACMRIGLFGGAGLLLAVLAVIRGVADIASPDAVLSLRAAYLLQIYAGCFMLLALVGCFCAASWQFSQWRINYQFILELNPHHCLDWRQLCDFSALFLFVLGLVMYLNFYWRALYLYWPLVVVGTWTAIMANPFHIYYFKSRRWFMVTLWRVLCSGFYSVEFRDLIFGDMMCSLIYVSGNISLFGCLYFRHWEDPHMCNSSEALHPYTAFDAVRSR